MKCPKCGKEIADESLFCEYCGAKIKRSKLKFPADRLKNKWVLSIFAVFLLIVVGVVLCFTLLSSKSKDCIIGVENGYEYVDMGLSVNWATCNVGSYSSSNRGDYFTWNNAVPSYPLDVAMRSRGDCWRLPTRLEFKELLDNCDVEFTYLNSAGGYKFISKKKGHKNQWIFLPLTDVTTYYWTSSLSETDSTNACCFTVCRNRDIMEIRQESRDLDCYIRPVCIVTSDKPTMGSSVNYFGLFIVVLASVFLICAIAYFIKKRKK